MQHFSPRFTRRHFLERLTAAALSFPLLEIFTEEQFRFIESGEYWHELVLTPRQTEGPFYPDKLPLDTDNDLLILGKGNRAAGQITHLHGKILHENGAPIKNAVIEIWQVDNNGVYIHSRSHKPENRDENFQGFGTFETASDGEYRFRTIKPVPYPGRTPHIHVKIKKNGRELLTTQLYVEGHPMNERDAVLRGIRDAKQRDSVIVPFDPIENSKLGELNAKFDIVLGITPTA